MRDGENRAGFSVDGGLTNEGCSNSNKITKIRFLTTRNCGNTSRFLQGESVFLLYTWGNVAWNPEMARDPIGNWSWSIFLGPWRSKMMVSYQDTWLMESNNPWTVAGGKALTELRRAEHLSISELTVFEDFFFLEFLRRIWKLTLWKDPPIFDR